MRAFGVWTLIACAWWTVAGAGPATDWLQDRDKPQNGPLGVLVPGLTDPLVKQVEPREARPGRHVLILGVNFGLAPQASFNGIPATTVGYRPDKQALVVAVPAGATTGPLIVTNTDTMATSNAAAFTVPAGVFTPVCTIGGNVTDDAMAPLANVVVAAIDPVSDELGGFGITDVFGDYSIGLGATGAWSVQFLAPAGSTFVDSGDAAVCSGTLDHQFVVGSQLSGKVRSDQMPFDPIPNAVVNVVVPMGQGFETLTDAGGDFSLYIPDGTYDAFVEGPIGGRWVATNASGIVVSGDTPVGNVDLESGWIVSGVLASRDGATSGPLPGAEVVLTDDVGGFFGQTRSIVDGSFFLAGSTGTDYTLRVSGGGADLVELNVQNVDLTSDVQLDRTLFVYSAASQAPVLPTVIEVEPTTVQEGQVVVIDAAGNLAGASVSVRFADGMGGFVDGVDTAVDPVRGLMVTWVPTGAVSGDIHIRVDGVDGPAYPVTVAPGVFVPGSFTLSGVVSDGVSPAPDALVALAQPGCNGETILDVGFADAGGNYTVNHPGGDFFLFVLPTLASGLTVQGVSVPGLVGNDTRDVTLVPGNAVTARCVDSGVGPIGATGSPIEGCLFEASEPLFDFEDAVRSDVAGDAALPLPDGNFEIFTEGPFQGRYLFDERMQAIAADFDFGDIALDSGFFIEGRVVDSLGNGIPAIEVSARDDFFNEAGFSVTVDQGYFRLAVAAGTYRLEFRVPEEFDGFVSAIEDLFVSTDTVLYPDIEAEPAGRVQGTVRLAGDMSPLVDVFVNLSDFGTGSFAAGNSTCDDGTYDIKVPSGSYDARVSASFENPCLADQYYPGTAYHCDATPVAVTAPSATTGIDFLIEAAGSVSGTVVDDFTTGLGGVTVCVDEGPGGPECSVRCEQTEPDGSFSLAGIPVGDYRVSLNGATFPVECWDDRVSCAGYDPVAVGDCVDTGGLIATLSNAAGPVPDGLGVSGVQMTADYDRNAGALRIYYQATCSADGHAVYLGDLGSFGGYTMGYCDVGRSGQATVPAPGDSAFFLVTGVNGFNVGSYGRDSGGFERPDDAGVFCGHTQSLSASCLPETSVCGDSTIEGAEVCEDANLGGESCIGLGFDGGTLACGVGCGRFDTSDCVGCGNGKVEGGEECDDGNMIDGDGCSSACVIEFCGDGLLNVFGETCDPPGLPTGGPDECRIDCTYCGDGVADFSIVPPTDSIVGGGFDSWGGVLPDGWQVLTSGGTPVQNTTVPRTGPSCLELQRTSAASLRAYQNVTGLIPGEAYELNLWARVTPTAISAQDPLIVLFNSTRTEWLRLDGTWGGTFGGGTVRGGITAPDVWTEFRVPFRTPSTHAQTDSYTLSLWHSSSDLGVQLFYDDVSLLGPYGEQCDDANNAPEDGCTADCLIE